MRKCQFSFRRVWLLFRKDMREELKSSLVVAASLFAVLFFLSLTGNPGSGEMDYSGIYGSFLFAGGFVFTSASFRELHRRDKNVSYLLLPASVLEKLAEKIISTTLVWILFASVIYTACLYSAVFLKTVIFGLPFPDIVIFRNNVLPDFIHYTINSSVFLLGALTFRKMHFLKTVLSIFFVVMTLTVFTAVSAGFIFGHGFRSGISLCLELKFFSGDLLFNGLNAGNFLHIVAAAARTGYYALLAPFFWFVSFLRLGEAEARNGI